MHRRHYLATVASLAGVGMAGCAEVQSQVSQLGGGQTTIGESQTYEGVVVTPRRYVLARDARRVYSNNTEEISAPSGATFLFTELNISHEGDSEQEFPPDGSGKDAVSNVYDGSRVYDGGIRGDGTQRYVVDGTTLVPYGEALSEEGAAMGGVYPGTEVTGWIFAELAANFDPAKLELKIVWNQQIVGDEGEEVQRWQYAGDNEVSPDEISE